MVIASPSSFSGPFLRDFLLNLLAPDGAFHDPVSWVKNAMALVVSLLCLVATVAAINVPLATFDGSKNTTFEFKVQKREGIGERE